MKNNELYDQWKRLTLNSNIESSEKWWQNLINTYGQKRRYYHNLTHIRSLVNLINLYKSEIKNADVLLLAVFFHDIVYQPAATDNELKSSEVAELAMRDLGFGSQIIKDVKSIILQTRNHHSAHPETEDVLLFLDMDLCIIGAEPDVYRQYSMLVAKEFIRLPTQTYKRGRIQFLQNCLNQKRLFHTALFYDQFEDQARKNLKEEIQTLL